MIIYLFPFFFSIVFLLLYEKTPYKHNQIYFVCLLLIGFFGGIRYETGQDWLAYSKYFDSIIITDNIITEYFDNWEYKRFEFGYFLLNVFIKKINLPYYSISFISSLFFVMTLYFFTKKIQNINKFIILFLYLSYSFLILEFAQVRQSIAISFFLIGFTWYLRENKIFAAFFFFLSIFFQYSSIIYLGIFFLMLLTPSKVKYDIIIGMVLSIFILLLTKIGLFETLRYLSPENLHEKIDIYKENKNQQGIGQVIYSLFLLLIGIYIYVCAYKLNNIEKKLCRYSVFSIIGTVLVSLIFPNNYVMYSRMYLIASIFLGISLSIVNKNYKGNEHKFLLFTVLIISFIYFYRLFELYSNEYLPYKTWLLN